MLLNDKYRYIYQFMNNDISCIYALIYDNRVLLAETNLKCFYDKLKLENIGINFSRSTLRNRFLSKNRTNHTYDGRVYWLQKLDTKEYY